jgi:hypothetical protein
MYTKLDFTVTTTFSSCPNYDGLNREFPAENENHEKWMKDTRKISGNVKELRSKDGVNVDFLQGW